MGATRAMGKENAATAQMNKCTRSNIMTDNLKDVYTSLADDSAASGKKREAAMMFSMAETHLNDDDADEALSTANDALEIFKEIGDKKGLADSLRLVVHVHRIKAEIARYSGTQAQFDEAHSAAEDLANENLTLFRDAGDKNGEAAMVLSLAEINCNYKGAKRDDALDCALESLDMFREMGDAKMEARALFTLAEVLAAKRQIRKAMKELENAVKIFQGVGDKKGESEALYLMAVLEAMSGNMGEGVRSAKKSAAILEELGNKKLQALTLYNIGLWHMDREEPTEALAMAGEAMSIAKGIDKDGKAYEAIVMGLFIQAHILDGDGKKSLDLATEWLSECKEAGGQKEIVRALYHVAHAQFATNDTEEALKSGEEAADACKELENQRWLTTVKEFLVEVNILASDMEKAEELAKDGAEILQDIGAAEDEAIYRMHVMSRVKHLKADDSGALEECKRARELAQGSEEKNIEALALMASSAIRNMTGKYEPAVKEAQLAVDIYHAEGDRQGEARAFKTMSNIHIMNGDLNEAMRTLKQAEQLMQDFDDKRELADIKYILATYHLAAEKPTEAARTAMDALKLAREQEDLRCVVKVLFMILDANTKVLNEGGGDKKQLRAYKQGCEKALRFASQAVGMSIKLKDKDLEGWSNHWLAFVNLMGGNAKAAETPIKTAGTLAKETGDKVLEVSTLMLTAQSHVGMGDQAKAIQVLNEALTLAAETDASTQAMVKELHESIVGKQQVMMAQMPAAGMAAAGGAVSAVKEEVFKGPEPMMVRQYINGLVQNMTGSSEEIDGDTPLMESGIDSLASVELRTQLQQEFKLNLPSTVMFNYPTISTMTQLLVEECTTKKISWGS